MECSTRAHRQIHADIQTWFASKSDEEKQKKKKKGGEVEEKENETNTPFA